MREHRCINPQFLHWYFSSLLALLIILPSVVSSVGSSNKQRKIHLLYPVNILGRNETGVYEGTAQRNQLTCLGHDDLPDPTFMEIMGCMVFLPLSDCSLVWGSRTVFVSGMGSVEFLRVPYRSLPQVSNSGDTNGIDVGLLSLQGTRWLEMIGSGLGADNKETRQVPAEPIALCMRSNSWRMHEDLASFKLEFRPTYIRERDRLAGLKKLLGHIALTIAASSVFLLPYLLSAIVTTIAYSYGLKHYMAILLFCSGVVMLTPMMFTRKNRHLAKLYINHFFTRVQAEETRMVIKQRLPLFQAVFFSSLLTCLGSSCAYIVYAYCGVEREWRNVLLKCTIGISSGWLVFYITRAFERFFKDWIWILMAAASAQALEQNLNPHIKLEVVFSVILLTLVVKLSVPRFLTLIHGKVMMELGGVWSKKTLNRVISWKNSFAGKQPVSVDMSKEDNYIQTTSVGMMSGIFLPDSPIQPNGALDRSEIVNGEDEDEQGDMVDEDNVISVEDFFGADSLTVHYRKQSNSIDSYATHGSREATTRDRQKQKSLELNDLPLWSFIRRNLVFDESYFGLFEDEIENDKFVSDDPIIKGENEVIDYANVSNTEVLNRHALSYFLDMDLSALNANVPKAFEISVLRKMRVEIDSLGTSSNIDNSTDKFAIGRVSRQLYAVGPLRVNNNLLWIPIFGIRELSALRCGCSMLISSTLQTTVFLSRAPRLSAQLRSHDYQTALSVERWVQYSHAILCSLIRDALISPRYSKDDCFDLRVKLIATAVGRTIDLSIFYSAQNDQGYPSSSSASGAMEGLVLAVLEQFPSLELQRADLFCQSSKTGPLIGVEVQFNALSLSVNKERLLNTHKFVNSLQNKSSVHREVLAGLMGVVGCIEFDISQLFDVALENVELREVTNSPELLNFSFTFPKLLLRELEECSVDNLSLFQRTCMGMLCANGLDSDIDFSEVLASICAPIYLGALHKLSFSRLFSHTLTDAAVMSGKIIEEQGCVKMGLGMEKDVNEGMQPVFGGREDIGQNSNGSDIDEDDVSIDSDL